MQAGNLLAFIVGTNQPLYPVYLAFIVGGGAWRALPLLVSMPLFLVVPLLARRSPRACCYVYRHRQHCPRNRDDRLPGRPGCVVRSLPGDRVCDSRGHLFVLLRADCYVDANLPVVIELAPDGQRLAAWGDAAGNLYLAEMNPSRVTQLVPEN